MSADLDADFMEADLVDDSNDDSGKVLYLKLSPGTTLYRDLLLLSKLRRERWQTVARKALDRYLDDFLSNHRPPFPITAAQPNRPTEERSDEGGGGGRLLVYGA